MNRVALWLWLLVILLRLLYALLATQVDPLLRANPLHGDAVIHDRMAWRLASAGEYRLEKGLMTAPAYIYLMAGVYTLVGHAPMAIRLLNASLGLLTLWGLWQLTRKLTGERAAQWVLLLGALHPHLLMITGWLYTENLALPLAVWAVYCLCYGRGAVGALGGGVLLGLLALTRANYLPFALLAALWLLWRGRSWQAPMLTLVATLVTVAPYVAYISARYGAFIPIGLGGYVLLWANNEYADGGFDPNFLERELTIGGETKLTRAWLDAPDPVQQDRQAMRLAFQWIRENPVAWLTLLGRKLALTLSAFGLQNPENRDVGAALRFADGVYWVFLALAGYGLWRLGCVDKSIAVLLALLIGWTLFTILLYAGGSRALLPVQPFLVLGAAVGLTAVRRATAETPSHHED
ncbi:MAG: glycosyltransferase family 39 protein [Fimbriimonadales bacterium]|nr:glycosyltransferase family 39 protein [Fimbriimonadales bacterium]